MVIRFLCYQISWVWCLGVLKVCSESKPSPRPILHKTIADSRYAPSESNRAILHYRIPDMAPDRRLNPGEQWQQWLLISHIPRFGSQVIRSDQVRLGNQWLSHHFLAFGMIIPADWPIFREISILVYIHVYIMHMFCIHLYKITFAYIIYKPCIYIYVHGFDYMNFYTHTYVFIYIYLYIYIYIYTYFFLYTYIYIYTFVLNI